MEFQPVDPTMITDNVCDLMGNQWMLVTAGTREAFNTMTASWGGMGVIWGKNVCFCVVRPVRYTFRFMESTDRFTLSFFDDRFRKALSYCGSHSGRDVDKIRETGLTPVFGDDGIYYAEARLVLCCGKLYFHDIDPSHFIDPALDSMYYPDKDYHRMYIGEILSSLVKR